MGFNKIAGVLAAAILGHSAAMAAADVAGIAIGSNFTEQKAAIQKLNPKYQFTEMNDASGRLVGLQAHVPISQATVNSVANDHFAVVSNEAGKVWFVSRGQSFLDGERIKYETFLSSVKEKYGPYTTLSTNGRFLTWQFDRNGKLYQGKPEQGPCYVPEGITGRKGQLVGSVHSNRMVVPEQFNPRCGYEILGSLFRDPRTGLVSGFSMSVVDSQDRVAAIQKNPQMTPDETRRRNLEAEEAKDNKPKL